MTKFWNYRKEVNDINRSEQDLSIKLKLSLIVNPK